MYSKSQYPVRYSNTEYSGYSTSFCSSNGTFKCWIPNWIVLGLIFTFREAPGKELPVRPANVVFLVDESNSIWEGDFRRELRFVQETVRRFEIGSNFTRVALVTYSMYANVKFDLDVYHDAQSIIRAVDKIRRPEGHETRLTPALKTSSSIFGGFDIKSCQSRRSSFDRGYKNESSRSMDLNGEVSNIDSPINILIVMGDGELNDLKESFEMIRCLSRQRIHLFSVGVGRRQIKRVIDLFAVVPHLYRISIDSYDPPNHPTDAISGSKSAPIWELMLKYRAMTEECIPHKEKIVLNFIFDIISKKSWRFPTFIKIAEDMYFRLLKKLRTTKKDFVRIRFFPRNFALNNTEHLRNKLVLRRKESDRFREMLEQGRTQRKMKKIPPEATNNASSSSSSTRKKPWELINSVLSKIQHTLKQQIVIYVTDRETEQVQNVEEISRIMRKHLRMGVKLEMFAIALGSQVKESTLSSLLRLYHTSPQSRLFVFKARLRGYAEAMDNFTQLFCSIH